eukprot:3854035-Rhodomonas_salina.2
MSAAEPGFAGADARRRSRGSSSCCCASSCALRCSRFSGAPKGAWPPGVLGLGSRGSGFRLVGAKPWDRNHAKVSALDTADWTASGRA